jgi:hypothetical protein
MDIFEAQPLINNIGVDKVDLDSDKMILMLNNGDEVHCTIDYPVGASDGSLEFEYIDKSLAI